MKNQVLVTVSGQDQPGITSSLMEIIEKYDCDLIDIGQSVTHGLLSLSIMLQINNESNVTDASVLKDLLFCTNKMNLRFDYQEVKEIFEKPSTSHEKFILNCVSTSTLTASFLKEVSKALAQHQVNILRIDSILPTEFTSLEITTNAPNGLNWTEVKKSILEISNSHKVDMAFLKDNVFRRNKRLIVFDMDSTLIQTEVIDEMAMVMGVGDEVKAITEAAMNGELDFDQSLKKRVSKLKGLTTKQMKEILNRLPLTPGVEEFIQTVKSLGYKVAVISGGFSYFADAFKDKLGLDYAFANELEIVNDKLTGEVEGTIINAKQKAFLLKVISQQEGISLEQVVAIGDGANDLPMLSTAGLGIAFHAKDIVKKQAPHQMGHGPMTTILYFLGIPGPMTH